MFFSKIGNKKIYRLLDRYSCNVEKFTNSKESFNVGTVIENTAYRFTTCAEFLAEIGLIPEFFLNSTFDFFHYCFGRV